MAQKGKCACIIPAIKGPSGEDSDRLEVRNWKCTEVGQTDDIQSVNNIF
jgi:hypothetical protein